MSVRIWRKKRSLDSVMVIPENELSLSVILKREDYICDTNRTPERKDVATNKKEMVNIKVIPLLVPKLAGRGVPAMPFGMISVASL